MRQLAAAAGVSDDAIESARDSDDPKGELRRLIQAHSAPLRPSRSELQPFSVKELRMRATTLNVPETAIEEARDSEAPKSALIDLILAHD